MTVQTFRDDDPGYQAWLTTHPSGWVVNAKRSPSPAYLKLHSSRCATISHLQAGYSRWTTGDYIKVCAERREELDAWALQMFAAELQDGCHCVQYGATAHRPSARRVASSPPVTALPRRPVVVDDDGYGTVDAPGVIPFEPKDPGLVQARAELRALLGAMAARPGELLHGVIEGRAAAGTDLDNALLYNVGGHVARAARHGVILERRPAAVDMPGARYRYRITRDPAAGEPKGGSIVELDGVDLNRQPRLWPDVWAAVRTSPAVRVIESAPDGELAMFLRVGAPRFAGAANGQFVKTLVDGVLTGLHAHADPTTASELGRRLAANLTLPAENIAALLLANERAALGACQRLIVLRDRGVQCQPEDHRVAVLRIELDRTATSWTLTGRITGTRPVSTDRCA